MNYRVATVFAKKSYTADFSEVIPILLTDVITRLHIQYDFTNTGTAATTAHPAKCIKKIELADGSDVLWSLNGSQAYGRQFFQNKVPPSDWLSFIDDNEATISFRLDFGRWLGDLDIALDPKRFNNLQLKIENDLDAGGVAPDACKLTVTAYVFDQKSVSPVGMICVKEEKKWTLLASSHEYTELPRDLKLRKLLFRGEITGTEMDQAFANLKLSEDSDKHVIIDHTPAQIVRMFPDENREYTEYMWQVVTTSARHLHCTPSSRIQVNGNEQGSTCNGYVTTDGGAGQLIHTIGSGTLVCAFRIFGFEPCSMISIPFGDEFDPGDWFDPTSLKSLRFDVLGQASATTPYLGEVVLEQLRPY